jgi:hypothetical protein
MQSRQACQPSQLELTYLTRSVVVRAPCSHRLSPVRHVFESALPEYLSNILADNAAEIAEVTIIYLPFCIAQYGLNLVSDPPPIFLNIFFFQNSKPYK